MNPSAVTLRPRGIVPWLLALRPKTLTAALVPVGLGSVLAYKQNPLEFQLSLSVFALVVALCIQAATNLINDALDFKKGTDTHARLGPRRVSASGWIDPKHVLAVGFVFLALAAIFGIPLIQKGGLGILLLGILCLFCAYAYTGGPKPLAYVGLGDVFVLIFFGWVATAGVYYIHVGSVSPLSLIHGTQVGLLSVVLIAINNLRDIAEDSQNNKKTLAVRLGKTFVRFEILFCILISFSLLGLQGGVLKSPGAGIWLTLCLILASRVVRNVFVLEPSRELNGVLAKAAALHMLFGVGLSLLHLFQN